MEEHQLEYYLPGQETPKTVTYTAIQSVDQLKRKILRESGISGSPSDYLLGIRNTKTVFDVEFKKFIGLPPIQSLIQEQKPVVISLLLRSQLTDVGQSHLMRDVTPLSAVTGGGSMRDVAPLSTLSSSGSTDPVERAPVSRPSPMTAISRSIETAQQAHQLEHLRKSITDEFRRCKESDKKKDEINLIHIPSIEVLQRIVERWELITKGSYDVKLPVGLFSQEEIKQLHEKYLSSSRTDTNPNPTPTTTATATATATLTPATLNSSQQSNASPTPVSLPTPATSLGDSAPSSALQLSKIDSGGASDSPKLTPDESVSGEAEPVTPTSRAEKKNRIERSRDRRKKSVDFSANMDVLINDESSKRKKKGKKNASVDSSSYNSPFNFVNIIDKWDEGTSTRPIIIDAGSIYTSAGFAGEPQPRVLIPSLIGKPRNSVYGLNLGMKSETYIGEASNRGILTMRSPVQKGRISSWDDLEKLWNHIFTNELRVRSNGQTILLTQDFNDNNSTEQERMVQIMFETFGVKSCYIINKGVAALTAYQRDTGFVVDMGTNASFLLPIYSSSVIRHAAAENSYYTGNMMSEYLMSHLNMSEHDYQLDLELASLIREKMSYVATDFSTELHKLTMMRENCGTFELPGSRYISLSSERIQCTEALFQPVPMFQRINLSNTVIENTPSLPDAINNSLNKLDSDLKKIMTRNLLLAGCVGTTLPGLNERLEKELVSSGRKKARIEGGVSLNSLNTPSNDDNPLGGVSFITAHKTWVGCSTWASLKNFPKMCVSKEDYNEYGPPIAHRVCF